MGRLVVTGGNEHVPPETLAESDSCRLDSVTITPILAEPKIATAFGSIVSGTPMSALHAIATFADQMECVVCKDGTSILKFLRN